MSIEKIRKRTCEVVDFNPKHIFNAIQKASDAAPENFVKNITDAVVGDLEEIFGDIDRIPDVEEIQDLVERKLVESGNFEIAKKYILYRARHANKRAEHRLEELKKLEKNLLKVKKHNGKLVLFSRDKLKNIFNKANAGFKKECKFNEAYCIVKNKLVEGIKTEDLLDLLIKACIDLISVHNTAWQNVAGRLFMMGLYKKASKNRKIKIDEIYSANSFNDLFSLYIKKGLYYKKFYDYYSLCDIKNAGDYIKKERDFTYTYSTVFTFYKRYLLNPNKDIYELPQEMYMSAALFLAIPEKQKDRLGFAKKIYDVISTQKLSLPTPTLLNARTNFHQLASCFKLNVADDLRSIYHSIENIAQISKFGGGVGIYLGHIRSRGSEIRKIKNASGGVIPWVKVINDTACAVNQLGARQGAVSPTLDIWHKDINDFLNLQTETGDIRSKAFDIFPAVSIPDIFMKRVESNDEWTLFDPYEIFKVTGKRLEDYFCDEFEEFYLECENNKKIFFSAKIKAKELMKKLMKTAVETGLPYVFFRDTVNAVNPNKHAGKIYSSQLCTEICQNTSESHFIEEISENNRFSIKYDLGTTVVCNLASINMAKVYNDEHIKEVFPVAMRLLDNIIDLNFYPIKEAEVTAKKYRSVGLGFMGLAEYLACAGLSYESAQAREHVDELFEKYALAALEESNSLSKERGAYELFKGSEWEKGIIFGRNENWYKENSKQKDKWAELIKNIKRHGLRFAYHLSPAPNTSTSVVVGTTAGLLPIYKKFFVETNAIAPIVRVAPNLSSKNFWFYKEYPNMDMNDVIDMIAVIYKWIDQSVSFEWLINPAQTSPLDLYNYYIKTWKAKIKTIYYIRSMSGEVKETCESCSG